MTSSGDIAELLRSYFIQHRSVHLPGIGGFELSRIPAQADMATGRIEAPYYTVRYDSLSDIPSKEMFSYISRKKNLSEWEAIGVINNFSMALSDQLKKGQRFEWEGIGSLGHGLTGQLEFQPEVSHFEFMPDLNSSAVITDNENSADHVAVYGEEEEDTVEMKASWWVAAAVVAAVALAMIFFSFVRNEYKFGVSRDSRLAPDTAPLQHQTKLAD
jgi:nucleoid DNA-binding protein